MLWFLVSDRTESFGEHDLSILFYASIFFFCLVWSLQVWCGSSASFALLSRLSPWYRCWEITSLVDGSEPKVWLEKSSSGLACSHFFASGSTRATRVVVKSMFRYVRGLIGTSWLAKLQASRYIAITKMNQIAGKREYPIYPYDWTFEFGVTDFTTKDIFCWKQRQRARVPDWWAREVAGSPVSHQTSSVVTGGESLPFRSRELVTYV
jgi:hypothetical protein